MGTAWPAVSRLRKEFRGIRPGTPLSLDDAQRLATGYVHHYNNVRLNSATGYITPKGHAGGAAAGDPRGLRPEVGGGPETTADSPPASRLTCRYSPLCAS